MKVVKTISEVRNIINQWKTSGLSIGFVPTMGYLHEGHGSLITQAKENDKVIVSIFLNPIQFAPNEDLSSYPKDLKKDCALCESLGADLLFCPSPSEMYAKDFPTYVDMSGLTENLCGNSRPTHFRGVCTVVTKLFNIVKPDVAYFGQKDAQQLAIIKQMVTDLNMDVQIIGCPIVREDDGLAKSSRNSYLSKEERQSALVLYHALLLARNLIKHGETNLSHIISKMKDYIAADPLTSIDYVDAVNALTMQNTHTIDSNTLFAIAVYIGKTRLIDNLLISEMEELS